MLHPLVAVEVSFLDPGIRDCRGSSEAGPVLEVSVWSTICMVCDRSRIGAGFWPGRIPRGFSRCSAGLQDAGGASERADASPSVFVRVRAGLMVLGIGFHFLPRFADRPLMTAELPA